jgi:hypothetical protein
VFFLLKLHFCFLSEQNRKRCSQQRMRIGGARPSCPAETKKRRGNFRPGDARATQLFLIFLACIPNSQRRGLGCLGFAASHVSQTGPPVTGLRRWSGKNAKG